ncbi:5'-nucleotidase domain-containing protein 1 isoform X1 [Trichogramma pretiosum]|uniref:5'-nucleotidase domain-containing protein 1 isoform X1 n=2 Tax=Trichogramma pretiosum TaxID=7493 RepID=UPI0006C9CB09|nr:5'-nucleotidase domain-containing protein 1 isoform X1 [Trichogramma pretiosum]XP_014234046.1 5'-nucleotidase domain-containing protein 1 isoform X1 [Trichogramma pretiosum]
MNVRKVLLASFNHFAKRKLLTTTKACSNFIGVRRLSSQFLNRNLQCDPKKMSVFRFSDYDCIGFDLDSTIVRYHITNLVLLEYDVITTFLIEKKGYHAKYLKEPLTHRDIDFIQKGLFFDFDKGNIVKLTPNGSVYKASHGTKMLNNDEIEKYYPNRQWMYGEIFSKNPLMTWNGPFSAKIRTLLDCFDMPAGLVFAKVVDALDTENGGKPLDQYNIWPDILDAFADMYSREQVQGGGGNFYPELKKNPAKYIHKCDPRTLEWIKKLKETKKTYLITGSNLDFVEVTTSYAFGENWKSLFDVIICYAKKPAFFTDNRPFYSLKNYFEDEVITARDLKTGGIYNQGNWKELAQFFSNITGVDNPKCLYVGDNMLQDIYAPSCYASNCDTMVISEEQLAERLLNHDITHHHEDILTSKIWGSFFHVKENDVIKDSFWNFMIKKYSKLCIPKLEMVIDIPLNEPINCFTQEDGDKELSGYHPAKPVTLANI